MKKVLVITYYWPPGGGGGVQRWLKFVKYLRNYGWEPVVYTPENPEVPAVDESLLKDIPEGIAIVKRPVWEPYSLYKNFTGKKSSARINTGFLSEGKKPGLTESLAVWIRGNLFIPDARKFWIKPSVKFLKSYLAENPVDAIVTTGPPHSMHLIGLGLKKESAIPWIADFRDPWTNIDYYHELKLGKRADKIHHKQEKQVLNNADGVTVVTPGMALDFSSIVNREYTVIPNGFDAEDMKGIPQIELNSEKFIISHIGSLTKSRNPKNLWKVLHELCEENVLLKEILEIHVIGKMDFTVAESLKEQQLEDKLIVTDYLPHDKVLIEQRKANILLLLVNDTPNSKLILTGKLFEYMAAERPVLCIGPKDGDAAKVLQETNSGHTFDFNDHDELKERILKVFKERNAISTIGKHEIIQKYERKNLTKRMAQALDSVI